MATNDDSKNKLAKNANGSKKAISPEQKIEEYMKRMAPRFADVLPKHMDMDRMTRIALPVIITEPELLECFIPSLIGAAMEASLLGIERGLTGHGYIIAYGTETPC